MFMYTHRESLMGFSFCEIWRATVCPEGRRSPRARPFATAGPWSAPIMVWCTITYIS